MKNYSNFTKIFVTKTNLLITLFVLFISTSFGQTYCTVGVTNTVEQITLVDFAGINNSTANTGTPGYQDFSAISANVVAGTSYTITLKGNTLGNNTCYFRLYVDWNGDGDFFDTGESIDIGTIINSSGVDSKTVTKSIAVPACDVAPTVRMRIIKNFSNYDSGPCSSVSYGQIEDYTLNISNPGGMTAYTVTGGNPDMPNASVGLSGSDVGVSYQLKKNGVNVGSPIPGTGSPISFGNQVAGIYTVEAVQSSSCTKTMIGNVTVAVAIFDYSGADQTYIVPPCATKIRVHIWGAGGGGGDAIKQYTTLGGGGGYTTGEIDVAPNESLIVIVGAGGTFPASLSPYGGGGTGGGSLLSSNGANYTGNGGGRSAIKRQLTELGTAGGGGGGGETSGSGDRGGYGGAGGGLIGTNGYHTVTTTGNRGGKGGTQVAGGAGGSGAGTAPTSGIQFKGGNGGSQNSSSNKREGGGGGGGYYGGGGGAADNNQGGGGGGGSSYVGIMSNSSTTSGNATNGEAGNQSFEYNRGQYGVGGQTNASGKNGRVVIEVIEVDITAPLISTIVQTTCTSATGSVTLSGLPMNGTWTITQNPDQSTITGTGTTYTISNLAQGVTYSWSVTNNIGCTSNNSADVLMNTVPPVDQPLLTSVAATCAAAATNTISNYNATYTYTFNPSGPTVGAGGVISGGTSGSSYTVTAKNGACSSTASSSFTINDKLITPAVPTITTTSASCSSASVSTISNYDATYTYVFNPSGVSIGTGGLMSGMTEGTSYTVTASNATCSSSSSLSFVNNAQLTVPLTPTIISNPASCTTNGTSAISNYDASNSYTFTPSGATVGVGGVISGMIVGTSYTVTASNATCTSTSSSSFSNGAQITPPLVPTITTSPATCFSVGISTLSNYDATYTYTFNPTGPIVASGGIVNGMIDGTSYTVIASSGACASSSSLSFQNEAKLPSPVISVSSTVSICKGDSTSLTVNGADNYTWSPSGTLSSATDAIVMATPSSTTTYTVIGTNTNGCADTKTVTVTVLPIPQAVIHPSVTEGYTPLDVTFTNASTNATNYSWDLGNGQLSSINSPVSTIYPSAGEYEVTLIASNGLCADTTTLTITVIKFPEIEIITPNVFTPNGDGKNDLYFIDAQNAKTVYVEIFNRWGNSMFKLENLTDRWDGNDASDGVYFYKYKLTDLKDQVYEGHGFFHLLR